MKIFRHLGLMIAVFWCAAMVVAPMAAAAGAGQGMNQGPGAPGMDPGQSNQGNTQMQQGQHFGNGQNDAGPGQGNGPQAMNRTNMSEFRNMTTPGNRDPANMTSMNRTLGHGNMTRFNMSEPSRTGIPPPGDWDLANMTAANQTWHNHGDGNMTPPDQQQQNGDGQGPPGSQYLQQAQNQKSSSDSLIAELIDWLKDHGIS